MSPRYNTFLNSFQYGELSPRFMARTDTEQYLKGAQKIENMIVLPSGGVTRRPGTVLAERYADNSTPQTLIPFIFSKDEAYDLWIIGSNSAGSLALYLYVYRPSGVLGAVPVNEDSLPLGLLRPRGYVTSADLGPDLLGFLDQDKFNEIQFVQSGDLLFLVHKDIPPLYISRTAENTFTFNSVMGNITGEDANISCVLSKPYRDANVTPTTLSIDNAAVGSGRTLTASDSIFDALMARQDFDSNGSTYFKVTIGTTTGVFRVDAYVSSTVVTGTVIIAFDSTAASDNWQESAWSAYRGYPSSIGIFESRLIMGGNDAQPDTVWGSEVFNLFRFMQNRLAQDATTDVSGVNFFGTPNELDPFAFTPTAKEVNRIGWIQSGLTLAVGTLGQEFVATGGADRVLSASSVSFTDQTTVGSAPVQAIRVNKATVFVSRDGKRIYQYTFDNLSQTYTADNITAIAEHIINQTILDKAEQLDPDPPSPAALTDYISSNGVRSLHWQPSRQVLWILTTSGDLIGCTWDPSVKSLAWHRHILGGFSDGPHETRPFIMAAAVVPAEAGGEDCLHLLVRRVNGITLEVMGVDYSPHRLDYSTQDFANGEAPVYMDCAVGKVISPASRTVTGLTHLLGETVDVLADGFYHPQCVVDSNTGNIELNREASFVIVGLPYTPRIKLCPLDAGSPIGSAQGMTTRVDRATIRFYRTIRAIVNGPEESETIGFRPASLGMGSPLPLFTGDKKVNVPMGPETRCELEITQDQPFPMTILGVALRGMTNE